MPYIPKSRVNILEAQKGQLIYVKDSKPYTGPYIKRSDGRYFAGSDPYDESRELAIPPPSSNLFPKSYNTDRYSSIKKGVKSKLIKKESIPYTRVTPTEEDYEKFKYTRYFAKRVNSQLSYFEISKETYLDIKKQKQKYDFTLYTAGKLIWALRGNTRVINKNTLNIEEQFYPGLSIAFRRLDEFFSPEPLPVGTDPYYTTTQRFEDSPQLAQADKFTIESLSKPIDPLESINPVNYDKYNIEGRKDLYGVPIPNNLPPTYGFPKGDPEIIAENQKCNTCAYFVANGRKCLFWEAQVDQEYWCADYQPYQYLRDKKSPTKMAKFGENVYFNPEEEPTKDSILSSNVYIDEEELRVGRQTYDPYKDKRL